MARETLTDWHTFPSRSNTPQPAVHSFNRRGPKKRVHARRLVLIHFNQHMFGTQSKESKLKRIKTSTVL
jgi:hypothetical protein